MKSDLDRLMQEHNLDAILITGPAQHNPPMGYFTGTIHMTSGDLVIRRGEDPILFYYAMERDEAAKSGFKTKNIGDYRFDDLLKTVNGDFLEATVLRYQKMMADYDLTSGRLGIYGKMDVGSAYAIFSGLNEKLPDLDIIGQLGDSLGQLSDSVLMQAMSTKDDEEVERIRAMGEITIAVVEKLADFLTSQKSKKEYCQ